MKYFYIEPEVAGGLGEHAEMDRDVHPPVVKRLHYQLEGWLGDAILETFPVFIVTGEAKISLLDMSATGATFDTVEVTISDQFQELYPDRELPSFAWLKPTGKAGQDDVGAAADGRLVISQRTLEALTALGISNAIVELFDE